MKDKTPHLASPYKIYGAFALGLMTAIAFRCIIIFQHIQPSWVRPVWYFAVLGNFLFFYHRFSITQKRKHAVEDYRLIEKLQSDSPLSKEEKDVLAYLLSSIQRSPENFNYLVIFIFSVIAILIDIAFSLFH